MQIYLRHSRRTSITVSLKNSHGLFSTSKCVKNSESDLLFQPYNKPNYTPIHSTNWKRNAGFCKNHISNCFCALVFFCVYCLETCMNETPCDFNKWPVSPLNLEYLSREISSTYSWLYTFVGRNTHMIIVMNFHSAVQLTPFSL